MDRSAAVVLAGIPAGNLALYHRIRFLVGDPAAVVEIPDGRGGVRRTLIVRDIECGRARRHARADEVLCPAELEPAGGLSGDRETATAEALAELLVRRGIAAVTADRTFGLSYAEALRRRGIAIAYDPSLGVATRRAKDEAEIGHLRRCQHATEQAVERACRAIAAAEADREGWLHRDGEPLTSERIRTLIDRHLLELGFENGASIVAGGLQAADCHERGEGGLRTGEAVIVDVFPRCKASLYHGDCTRTVVHGAVPEAIARMHAAVVEAKRAATEAVRGGVAGEEIHRAAIATIHRHGYASGPPAADGVGGGIGMVHGTGHGIGLEVHEPPLLDFKGPPLVVGDAITIEPGLYGVGVGGVRVEDLVIVTADGCENLGRLPEGLDWR